MRPMEFPKLDSSLKHHTLALTSRLTQTTIFDNNLE